MDVADLLPDNTAYDPTGGLRIGSYDLVALASQYGTPLYVYDGATVRRQAATLQGLLSRLYPAASEITYAAKAYFSLAFARKLVGLGLGVDVVSLGELEVARRAAFVPSQIHLHGNNKSEAELTAALQLGVQAVVVDSLEELAFLEELAARLQKKGRVWLRVTPGITVDTHQYTQTAHPASKFGLPIQDGQAGEAILRLKSSPWLTLTGLHTHLGSQFFEAEPYRQAVSRLAELAEKTDFIPQEFSPGGGWGVPYDLNGKSSDPQFWIETVASAVQNEFSRRLWPLPRLVIEPGRWIVARAGMAIYTVGTSKTAADGTRFIAVDGGMADNIRPALYQVEYTALPVQKPESGQTQRYTLVGKFCETGDVLIPQVDLPPLHRGDLLAVPVAGAYQLAMSSNYNLAPRPAVLWLEDEGIEVMQKREDTGNLSWWLNI
jgi:diaminopimelate decarboxylase